MPGLHIRTLGEFTVRRGDVIVPAGAWPTQKSLSLFKLLVTERGRWVGGARLVETLWPALPTERAQSNLWVTVSQTRRVLEPHLVARAAAT
jgi:DNA-binding SARP family transcriptional activator